MKKFLFLIFCSLFLSACGAGSGEGLNESGDPIDGDPPDNGNGGNDSDGVSLQTLVEQIFDNSTLGDQRCTRCHSGASPLGGLNLQSTELAYANLVGANGDGVTANGNASFKRVLPGEPDESYIVLKLQGDSRAGSQMPLNETPLTPLQIAMVRDWIANGAPETGTGTSATVITKAHAPASDQVHIHFSRVLSTEQNIENVLEIYFTENGESWLASAENYEAKLDGQNLYINFIFPDIALEAYIVKINSPQAGVLLDSRNIAVDGNNNKQEGGVFTYEYRFQD